ncbi:hypothetical protein XELAEV_18008621mg [Xenopus laevis]|uniref:Uncharacterized protein n=1 Tax=Xenopus laevis TaxID=8355 RepID=A0A974E3X5_XENLA|nr:hypothetical protein XELAEV_18008621mg [Xenopus laevis]
MSGLSAGPLSASRYPSKNTGSYSLITAGDLHSLYRGKYHRNQHPTPTCLSPSAKRWAHGQVGWAGV